MDLISQLKEEHVQITRSFVALKDGLKVKKVEDHDFSSEIQNLQTVLVSHLNLEDQLLYPFFKNSKQEELISLGKSFSDEMGKIAKAALAFFAKYGEDNLVTIKNKPQFQKELLGIITVVIKRVHVEESILFPAYENYQKK